MIRRKLDTAWRRRGVLVAVLLAVIVIPLPSPASVQQALTCRGCHTSSANAQRWSVRLPGQWAVAAGQAGTVPVSGQAYVAVGGGLAVVGDGLTLAAYRVRDGAPQWQITLDAPAGAAIMSVRAWDGVVTAGIENRSGTSRTEAVIDGATGMELREYPAAVFGGAVAATPRETVIIGRSSVTSYDNSTGKVRWRRTTGAGQDWRTDGDTLYVTESGGLLGAAPVTGLQVINLSSGTERTLDSPSDLPFSGTLAGATDGTVLFTSASGVTAYSGTTGGVAWSMNGMVPEGSDPVARLVYLTSGSGSLTGVNPLTGKIVTTVSGSATTSSAAIYLVRGGVALGLDSGASGDAWGYSVAAGHVTWTAPSVPWPHYFSDLSGVGGSAAESGSTVVIAACPHLASASASPSPTSSPSGSPGTSTSPAPSDSGSPTSSTSNSSPTSSASATPSPTPTPAPVQLCADPELVALNV